MFANFREKNNMCKLIILRGNSGSGKTTIANELQRKIGSNIYAYYFDIPFEETIKRHKTRSQSSEFGEEIMREWWVDKDYSEVLNETAITADKDKESIIQEIYSKITEK